MDFAGPEYSPRVVSLHPGVGLDEVRDNTGFDLSVNDAAQLPETAMPTLEQLAVIAQLDPMNLRSKQLKDDPPGLRPPARQSI